MRLNLVGDERQFVQSSQDEYHLFPATLGMFVDINVDLDTDLKNIVIEVAMIEQVGDDSDADARAFSDGEFVGVIRVPVELVRRYL